MPENVKTRNQNNRDTLQNIEHYSGRPIELVGKRIEELEAALKAGEQVIEIR